MARSALPLVQLVQATGRIGIIIGVGGLAQGAGGVMALAREGHPMDLEEVRALGMGLVRDQARATVMGLEVVELMVVGMGLEVGLAPAVAEESAVQVVTALTANHSAEGAGTTMGDELILCVVSEYMMRYKIRGV